MSECLKHMFNDKGLCPQCVEEGKVKPVSAQEFGQLPPLMPPPMPYHRTQPGYEPLAKVLQAALDQSQAGKGKERHATAGKPFTSQPICEIGRMVGIGYNVGQAMKKGQEAMRLPTERAQAELLGAIVYMASAYLLLGEGDGSAERRDHGALPVCVNKMCKCYNESATSHCIGPFTDPKDCPEHMFDPK